MPHLTGLTLVCLAIVSLVRGGIDDSLKAMGRPRETKLPKCRHWMSEEEQSGFVGNVEDKLPMYFITGRCDSSLTAAVLPKQICLLLKMRGLFHLYYEDANKQLRCVMIPLVLDPSYNSSAFTEFQSDKQETNDTAIRYNIDITPNTVCHNYTCTVELNLTAQLLPGQRAQLVNSSLLGHQFNLLGDHFNRTQYEEYIEARMLQSGESVTQWNLKLFWHRRMEPYERGEINFSSVGATPDMLSGIYTLHGVVLTYRMDESLGFVNLKPEDRRKQVRLATWDMHRMRARAGDYYQCDHEHNVELKETNNTLLDPYENEDAYYNHSNDHLLYSENIRGLLVLQRIHAQVFSEHPNATQFHGGNTHCPADENNDHKASMITFSMLALFVLFVAIFQCCSRCREKEKQTKKSEGEGLNVFQQQTQLWDFPPSNSTQAYLEHQKRRKSSTLPATCASILHATSTTSTDSVPKITIIDKSGNPDDSFNVGVDFVGGKQRNLRPFNGRKSPMVFNAGETIAELTEDERKSSIESQVHEPLIAIYQDG